MKEIKGLFYYGCILIGATIGSTFYSITYGATMGSIFSVISIFVIATGIMAIVNGLN